MKNNELREQIINIAAMKLDFPLTNADIDTIANEIAAIPDEYWYWCTFRESYLICLYGNEDVNNKKDMHWLPAANSCYTLKKLCDEFIFPMTTIRPRIIVIRTLPGMIMKEHTDCYAHQLEKLEPKLRLVVKGREKNTLYFKNDKNEEIHIPDTWPAYIMSGATLHGMRNQGEEKYTICWGDPWLGDELENQQFVEYMISQISKNFDAAILRSNLGNVNHASGIKNPKVEKIYSWNEWNASKKNQS